VYITSSNSTANVASYLRVGYTSDTNDILLKGNNTSVTGNISVSGNANVNALTTTNISSGSNVTLGNITGNWVSDCWFKITSNIC